MRVWVDFFEEANIYRQVIRTLSHVHVVIWGPMGIGKEAGSTFIDKIIGPYLT
jgi:hypothetical protein